jgi:hypothetical protein
MSDDPTEDTDRLEQALERIAALAARRPEAAPVSSAAPANANLAARLDHLIAQLRATLSHTGA